MKVDYVEESSVRKALAFEIEAEVVQAEIEARAREHARKARLPGFRAGKVPAAVIRQRFHAQVLGEAAEAIVHRVVLEEMDGRGLRPLAPPRVTDLKVEEGRPMSFRAVFEVLPLLEVPDYRGLPVKARRPLVSEEALDAEIGRLREAAARYDAVEGRAAAAGDHVLLDVRWSAEGAGQGHDENVLVEVGGGDNHPDLDAALVGLGVGETRQARLAYAADHQGAFAGRTVSYTVTLKAVKTKVVPAADDEFARDLNFESLAEMRAATRRRLEAAEEGAVDREVKNALLELLAQRASFEVPETLVERHMTARAEGAARGLVLRGIDPGRAGVDWGGYRESQREAATLAARADLLLGEVARREGIEVSEAEVEAEITRLAERLRRPREGLRARMQKEGDLDALRARIREEKTLDLLKANARLTFE